MKNKLFKIPLLFVLIAVLLGACSTSGLTSGQSWPGLTADAETGAVYLANGSVIYAIDAESGSLMWSYPEKANARQSFYAKPAIADDQLVISDFKNNVIGLDLTSGNENWVFDGARDKFIGGSVFANDTIFAPSADNFVYALDLNGHLLFTMETEQINWSAPIVVDDVVYLASMDHNLYAFDAASGTEFWKTELGGAMNGSPVFSDGVLYVGTLNKEMFAVSAETGNIVWQKSVDSLIWSSVVVVNDMVLVGDELGRVYSFNAADGSLNWTGEMGSAVTAQVVVLEETFVVVSRDRDVVAFNFEGGKEWTRSVSDSTGMLNGDPVYVDGLIIIPLTQGSDKMLVAYDANGNEVWSFVPEK